MKQMKAWIFNQDMYQKYVMSYTWPRSSPGYFHPVGEFFCRGVLPATTVCATALASREKSAGGTAERT